MTDPHNVLGSMFPNNPGDNHDRTMSARPSSASRQLKPPPPTLGGKNRVIIRNPYGKKPPIAINVRHAAQSDIAAVSGSHGLPSTTKERVQGQPIPSVLSNFHYQMQRQNEPMVPSMKPAPTSSPVEESNPQTMPQETPFEFWQRRLPSCNLSFGS